MSYDEHLISMAGGDGDEVAEEGYPPYPINGWHDSNSAEYSAALTTADPS